MLLAEETPAATSMLTTAQAPQSYLEINTFMNELK